MIRSYSRFRPFEQWRAVPDFDGYYEVSDAGRVRSTHARWKDRPKILRLKLDECGYPEVCLCVNGKPKNICVHRLVALAFHGVKRNALHREVAHLDGVKTNNSAANLKWVSHAENMAHKRKHGTAKGSRHPGAKLTEADVLRIKTRYARRSEIASDFGISVHTVSDIWRGRRWSHLEVNRG